MTKKLGGGGGLPTCYKLSDLAGSYHRQPKTACRMHQMLPNANLYSTCRFGLPMVLTVFSIKILLSNLSKGNRTRNEKEKQRKKKKSWNRRRKKKRFLRCVLIHNFHSSRWDLTKYLAQLEEYWTGISKIAGLKPSGPSHTCEHSLKNISTHHITGWIISQPYNTCRTWMM